MGRLGIHSFVWTGGGTQAMLEDAMEKSAACGYRLIEFAYLKPEKFDLDRLAKRASILDLEIAVTMGLPFSADVSSEDSTVVRAGEELLANAVAAQALRGLVESMLKRRGRAPAAVADGSGGIEE